MPVESFRWCVLCFSCGPQAVAPAANRKKLFAPLRVREVQKFLAVCPSPSRPPRIHKGTPKPPGSPKITHTSPAKAQRNPKRHSQRGGEERKPPSGRLPLVRLVSACRVCMEGRTDAVEKLGVKFIKMNYLKYCTVFEVILFSDFVIRSLPSASPLAQGSATAPWATWEQTSRPVGRRLRNGALSIAACARNPNDFSYIRLLPKVGFSQNLSDTQLSVGPHGSKHRPQWHICCAMMPCRSQLFQETQMILHTFGCNRKSVLLKTQLILQTFGWGVNFRFHR